MRNHSQTLRLCKRERKKSVFNANILFVKKLICEKRVHDGQEKTKEERTSVGWMRTDRKLINFSF